MEWQALAELWHVDQFSNSTVEGGMHGRWWRAHGGALKLLPGCVSKFENAVAHDNLECLDEGLSDHVSAERRSAQEEGDSD